MDLVFPQDKELTGERDEIQTNTSQRAHRGSEGTCIGKEGYGPMEVQVFLWLQDVETGGLVGAAKS